MRILAARNALALFVVTVSITSASAKDYLSYFPKNYDESRETFKSLSVGLEKKYLDVEKGNIPVASKREADQDLTIDWTYVPPQAKDGAAKKLILITSAVHGIEGYAGAASQKLIIQDVLPKINLKDTGLLFIHGINPSGFRHNRRVSEFNVDLNRNFDTTKELFKFQNPGYVKLDKFLNPTKKANYWWGINEVSYITVPLKGYITGNSNDLRQAILQGQYKNPKGIFFGGLDFAPQVAPVHDLIKSKMKNMARVFVVDFHTGYGARGVLHYFGPSKKMLPNREALDKMFKGYKVDSGDDKDFYDVYGDFSLSITKLGVAGQEVIPMTFEYGTLDSQTTIGSMKSLNRVRAENQGANHGYTSARSERKIKEDFMELFYPSAASWKNKILEQAEESLPIFFDRFSKL